MQIKRIYPLVMSLIFVLPCYAEIAFKGTLVNSGEIKVFTKNASFPQFLYPHRTEDFTVTVAEDAFPFSVTYLAADQQHGCVFHIKRFGDNKVVYTAVPLSNESECKDNFGSGPLEINIHIDKA